MLYKILDTLPDEAKKDGSVDDFTPLPLIPLDLADGFIHLSCKDQVEGTLNTFFTNVDQVYILSIDAPDSKDKTPEKGKTGNKDRSILKWEWVESRKAWFPHLFGDLLNKDVVDWTLLKRGEDGWKF